MPRRVHPEKKGIRTLGIAESFRPGRTKSTLAGVVMRRDNIIDDIVFGSCTLEGDDATDNILKMYAVINRQDINCIMIDGLIISLYNIIDGQLLFDAVGIPVIGVTFHDSEGLDDIIRDKYGGLSEKMKKYDLIRERQHVKLHTGKYVFFRSWGASLRASVALLNAFTQQGSLPEPIRVAKAAARAYNLNALK